MTAGRRSALVVANDTYHDQRLSRLRAPASDAEQLAGVLRNAEIGGFDVEVSLNEPEHVVRRKVSTFFDDRGPDDLLLLHLSCHGVKDEDGRLYFATPDTEIDHLDATSLPADYVNRQMTRSRSRRIVLFLDCCYSGAFARGMMNRGDERMDIMERFDGRGRIVLTASSAMEYSFEGDQLAGQGKPSVFTSALVEGLATGEADLDRDGLVSVDELYEFAFDRVRTVTPSQTPGKWVFDVQGDFYIARSNRPPEPVDLLADLRGAISSPFTNVRLGAVEELAALLDDADSARAAAARMALDDMAEHDTERLVRGSAERARRPAEPPPPPPPPPDTPPPAAEAAVAREPAREPEPRPRPVAATEPQPAAWVPAVASLAAVGLLAAIPLPLLAEAPTSWNSFAVVTPFEVALAALALLVAASQLRRQRLAAANAAGLFIVVGILLGAAGIGLVKFSLEDIGAVGVVLSLLVVCGAAGAVVAGRACLSVSSRDRDLGLVEPVWLVVALAGAGLAIVALFIPYDGFSSYWTEVEEGASAEYIFEPAAVVGCLAVGMLSLSSRRRFATAVLISTGALTAVHYVGVVIASWQAIGEEGEVGSAGWAGIAGGLLAAFAAWQIQQSLTRGGAGSGTT
ncbi:Caspase domain-containing protein [Nocardioides sp. YR527]|uniref:caspase family protein n=1 Tax=Nocardioides sp. YR527 TaxID=1881028 RepID=UPI000884839B|nr:caspase family protein [Nocardioides sp. YR527]SDK49053.1 Caspase domain-containing protein [Nocardioides sp. YR527]